jgi:lipoprotein-anchoring transpeptidase ErfK/SrfK
VALISGAVLVLGVSGAGVAYARDGVGSADPVPVRGQLADRDTADPDAVDTDRDRGARYRGERYRSEEDVDGRDRDGRSSDTSARRTAPSAAGARPTAPSAAGARPTAPSAAGTRPTAPGSAAARSTSPGSAAGPVDDPNAPIPLDSSIKLAPPDPPGSLVKGTPCTKAAVACVSLKQNKSWLFKKDAETGETVIDHGPVPIRSGGPGKETPLGDFHVEWKNKNHKSGEYFVPHGCVKGTPGCEGAPMNWAVFFAEGGIAFHEGTLAIRSSGCVRLSAKEAEFYYTALQLGDKVEVRN